MVQSHCRCDCAKFINLAMGIKKRTVTPKNMRFSGYVVTSIDVHEDDEGIVHKIQLWCSLGALASVLGAVSHKDNLKIKNHAENRGILDSLLAGGIVAIDEDFDYKLLV